MGNSLETQTREGNYRKLVENEGPRANVNPILLPLVVENICKYLTFPELSVCRSLNQLWKQTAHKYFLKLSPPLLLTGHDEYLFQGAMTIAKFLEIYSNPSHPFLFSQLLRDYKNFRLVFVIEEMTDVPLFYEFLLKVGPQMNSLELEWLGVCRNMQDFADLISSKYTPHLENLVLRYVGMPGSGCLIESSTSNLSELQGILKNYKENRNLRRLRISLFWRDSEHWEAIILSMDVLSLYPNLQALRLDDFTTTGFEKMLTNLATLREADNKKLRLTELTRGGKFLRNMSEGMADWKMSFSIVERAKLPLEKISFKTELPADEAFSSFLQLHSGTLKSLSVKGSLPHPFPHLRHLEEINVMMCSDLRFLLVLQNLKTLTLSLKSFTNLKFPEEIFPIATLTTFNCWGLEYLEVLDLERLFTWMPNIENLEAKLDSKTFSWICQNLQKLKKLKVLGYKLEDSDIIGEIEGTPNVTNLRELETFTMEHSRLTGKSVLLGFSHMPHLSTLAITVKSKLSSSTMKVIQKRLKNVRVNVAPEQSTAIGMYMRTKEFFRR